MLRFFLGIAALLAGPAVAQSTLIGTYTWTVDDVRFGGFSALELHDDGQAFVALSDRGAVVTGRLSRVDGLINGVTIDQFATLTGPQAQALPPSESDSEGLALDPDGRLVVSFEWTPGLRRFDRDGRAAGPLMTTPLFDELQDNAALEALAIGPDGALYTLPERSGFATRPFPVFRLLNGAWDQPFSIPRSGPYLVSGADIGPDGMLYVLERDFVGIGFRSRVRRFAMDGTGEQTLLVVPILTHDNLEGISVWRDAQGLRMTLISDDNFRRFQRTEFVEYRLTD